MSLSKPRRHVWEAEGQLHSFLTSKRRKWVVSYRLRPLHPRKRNQEGRVGPTAPGEIKVNCPLLEFQRLSAPSRSLFTPVAALCLPPNVNVFWWSICYMWNEGKTISLWNRFMFFNQNASWLERSGDSESSKYIWQTLEHTFMNTPLWARSYEHTLMSTSLWAHPYEHAFMSTLLWAHPYEHTFMSTSLWARPYKHTFMSTPLWVHLYEHTLMSTFKSTPLWTHLYEHTLMSTPLWTRLYEHALMSTPLWAHLYEHTFMSTPLWAHLYEHTLMSTPLWAHPYEHTLMSTPLWAHPHEYHSVVQINESAYTLSLKYLKFNTTIYYCHMFPSMLRPSSGIWHPWRWS